MEESWKTDTNIQEGRQRGGRKLQISGWMTTRRVSDMEDQQLMQHKYWVGMPEDMVDIKIREEKQSNQYAQWIRGRTRKHVS